MADHKNRVIKKFENDVSATYETFQNQIEELDKKVGELEVPAFEEWKDSREPSINTVCYMYSNLYTKDHISIISDIWHDIKMWVDVKFLEIAKNINVEYCGNDTCKCHKCQKLKGPKNIRKIHEKKGYQIQKGHLEWFRANPEKKEKTTTSSDAKMKKIQIQKKPSYSIWYYKKRC